MSVVAIIPARYAATRFPGKPLAADTGKYLIQHVYEQACRARAIDTVLVATDDARIADAVRGFGGTPVMTRADHVSGTDRLAEVAAGLSADVIVNVQGDEPELDPAHIDRLVGVLHAASDCSMATLACPFASVPDSDPRDPHAVKAWIRPDGRALTFTRDLIEPPLAWPGDGDPHPLLHVGIYAYDRAFLLQFAALAPTALEQQRRLEQLRALDHGYGIAVGLIERATVGIDTPADYAAFVRRHDARQGTPS